MCCMCVFSDLVCKGVDEVSTLLRRAAGRARHCLTMQILTSHRAGTPVYYIVSAMPAFSGHQLILSPAQGLALATLNKDVLAVNAAGTNFISAGSGQGRIAQVRICEAAVVRIEALPNEMREKVGNANRCDNFS